MQEQIWQNVLIETEFGVALGSTTFFLQSQQGKIREKICEKTEHL